MEPTEGENTLSRILHLIASNLIGGPEKQLLHHALDTRDAGYEIILGSFQDDAELPRISYVRPPLRDRDGFDSRRHTARTG